MKNKSMFILLVSFLFAALFLSACGNSNDDANQGEQDNVDEEVETDEPTDEEEVEEDVGGDTSDENETNENSDAKEEDEEQAEETTDNEDDAESEPQVVLENEAFRIFEPAENAVVGNEFTVRGEARVFEGNVVYEFEDGHNILDEGSVTASAGAPEWGEFEFTISFDEVFFETGTVIIFEESAKDGSRINQLYIPVTVEK